MTAEPQQEAFALVTAADLAAVCSSAAIGAFLAKRIEQQIRYGHTPDGDFAKAPDHLPRQVYGRMHDIIEILHRSDHVPADRIDTMIKKVEAAGAMLMAFHDYLNRLEPPEGSASDA